MKKTSLAAALLLVMACSPIRQHEIIQTPTNQVLSTHIGGQILDIEFKDDMPNAYGGRDIWGKKNPAGSLVLIYQGLSDEGHVKLQLTEQRIESDRTTTSGMAYTTGGTTFGGTQPTSVALAPGVTQFEVNLEKDKILKLGKVVVEFINAEEHSVTYKLLPIHE